MVGQRKISKLAPYNVDRTLSSRKKSGTGQAAQGGPQLAVTSYSGLTPGTKSSGMQSPNVRSESILSGELGDSECSTQRSVSPAPSDKVRRHRWDRVSVDRDVLGRKVRVFRTGKRSIKLSSRGEKGNSCMDVIPGTGLLDLHRKFDVPMRRDVQSHTLQDSDSEMDEEQRTLLLVIDRASSESDEYDTDLEKKFGTPPLMAMDMSGRTRYLKACSSLGVAPCSVFLRQAVEEHLNLRYYGLGVKDVLALSRAFLDNTYLTHIDLSYNNIGTKGLLYITSALQENHYITHIELSYCFLGKERNGSRAVHALVEASKNIHHINLSHNCFKNRDYVWLAKLLQADSRLFSLDLSDNELGANGLEVFADALAENDILTQLNIQWNPLLASGNAIMLRHVAKNMKLKMLSLARTGMNQSALGLLATLLSKNDFLQQLDLRHNHFNPADMAQIHQAAEKAKSDITLIF